MFCFIQLSQIMPGLVMAAQLILALSILIILHEAGHYFVARFFGIRVEKFYLFFDAWGFKLIHFKKGDTEYGIGWLPLGGYVKIAGMIDESMDKEQMALPPKPDEFRSKPAWQRLLVMLGGVTVNLILGITIFWMLNFIYGRTFVPISKWKDGIVPNEAFKQLGVKAGDKIVKVGNKVVETDADLQSTQVIYGNTDLTIDRGGKTIIIHIPGDFSKKLGDGNSGGLLFTPRMRPMVDSLIPNLGGYNAGLKKGDIITGVNQEKIEFYDELQSVLKQHKNEQVNVYFIRKESPKILTVKLDTGGKIGFYPDFSLLLNRDTQHYAIIPALTHGVPMAFQAVGDQAQALGKMAKREISPQQLSGPIGIAKVFGPVFEWYKFWRITGVLSMILAFMNILPIPALDGGHVFFLLIEMVKGKPLSDKFLENAQVVGFFILVGLMVFIFGNDIFKMFGHH